jgi:hypothetical protein
MVPLSALGLTPEQAATMREEWRVAKENAYTVGDAEADIEAAIDQQVSVFLYVCFCAFLMCVFLSLLMCVLMYSGMSLFPSFFHITILFSCQMQDLDLATKGDEGESGKEKTGITGSEKSEVNQEEEVDDSLSGQGQNEKISLSLSLPHTHSLSLFLSLTHILSLSLSLSLSQVRMKKKRNQLRKKKRTPLRQEFFSYYKKNFQNVQINNDVMNSVLASVI